MPAHGRRREGDLNMKYDWDKLTEQQKIKAAQQEIGLATHNGTTKDDLLNILRWLWDKFEVTEECEQSGMEGQEDFA
jgi:hypothetical protein